MPFCPSAFSDPEETPGPDATMAASLIKVTTTLAEIAGARLTRLPSVNNGAAVKAATVWADRPTVILVLRRPG
jgi:hypothetical protein